MSTQRAQAEFPDLRTAMAFLLGHWRQELTALFGGSQAGASQKRQPEPAIQFRGNAIAVGQEDAGSFIELGLVPRDANAARLLSAAIVRFGLTGQDIRLSFSSADVLR